MQTKFIAVVGGVISGVGKGVTTASLGKILKEHGYSVTLIKIDPYINYDAGTLRPTEHGEVWVTKDGGEIDQDLGTYERFMDQDIPKQNSITTGQIYKAVIDRERSGGYLGKTVQFIPHIPEEVIRRIKQAAEGYEIAIIEVGGIVGDYENVPFLFALKSLERELGAQSVVYVLVAYLPVPEHINEMKTKPAQQAIRLLREEGIFPDFVVCRSEQSLDEVRKRKIEEYVHIPLDHIIAAPNVPTIYQIPLDLEKENFGYKVLKALNLASKKAPNWAEWAQLVRSIKEPKKRIKIGVVGKYFASGDFSLTDSYLSIYQALVHAGAQADVGIDTVWVSAQQFEVDPISLVELEKFDGVIIPGGFGKEGIEGKIAAIEYVRTHNIPYLGLCYGLQLAVIEFARHVCGMQAAHTTEVDEHTVYPVIDMLPMQKELLAHERYGGSMRLGAYQAELQKDSKVTALYQGARRCSDLKVDERHRHRYEVNPKYVPALAEKGMGFSGFYTRADGTKLVEFIELADHPFFVATQAHPEFTSRLGNANPLFYGLVKAAVQKNV